MADNYIILSGGRIINDQPLPVFDLDFLSLNEETNRDDLQFAIRKAKQTLSSMVDSGVYSYTVPIIKWLAEQDKPRMEEDEIPMPQQNTSPKPRIGARKFSPDQIREVREMSGRYSVHAIADQYKVSDATIYNILSGKAYGDVK